MSLPKLLSHLSRTVRLVAVTALLATALTLVAQTPASAAVSGLKASSVTASDATISWNRFSGATRYRVYWSTSRTMPGTCEPNCRLVTPANAANPSVALSAVTNLTPGRTYYVKVSPVNSAGRTLSGWQSTPLTVTLSGSDGGGSGAIPGTVQNITSTNITSANATISWDTVPTATKYRLYIRTTNSFPSTCEPNCWVRTPRVTGDRASVNLADVLAPKAGTTYHVKISAINAANKTITGWQPQAHSLTLSQAEPTIPKTVQNIVANDITESDATITWDAIPTAATYRLYIRTTNSFPGTCEPHCWVTAPPVSGGKASVRLSSFVDVTPGSTYHVKISASGSNGKLLTGWQPSAYSFTLAAPPSQTIPSHVQNIRATDITGTNATLAWDPVPTASSYRVYIRTNSTFPSACEPDCWVVSPPVQGNTVSVPLDSLIEPKSGTTYYVKISASGANGKLLTGWQPAPYEFRMGGRAVVNDVSTMNTTSIDTRIRWAAFPDAAKYRVYWSTSPTMPSSCEPTCKIVTVSNSVDPHVALSSLTRVQPGATYHLKVSALRADNSLLTTWQEDPATVTIGPGNKAAVPTNVRFSSTSPTSVTVAWDSNAAAPAHLVELRGATSRTIRTVEREVTFAGLTPGARYTVAVRTAETDGAALSARTAAREVTTPTSGVRPLRTGSFNVRCANCTTGENDRPFDELPWADRRLAVADNIVSRNPAVIGVQEVSQGWLRAANGDLINRSQFEDLELATAELGRPYKVTNTHRNNCVRSTTPTACVYQDRGASQGTRIFFDPAQVTMLDQGSVELPRATSSSNPRYLTWAEFRRNDNQEKFFFANTHLEPGSSGVFPAARAIQSLAMVQAMENLNNEDLPAVLAGDMNSTRYFTPNSPFDALTTNGWLDPLGHVAGSPAIGSNALAESRVRANYNSYNGFTRNQRRYGSNQNGSNLDYLFVAPSMRVTRWETVVRLDGQGNLTEVIPSDHNALYADVVLP